jgi:2-polyprenyl-3-methyl-5-hydroxy-6-metoxy-1,4-benzoquinol methylase
MQRQGSFAALANLWIDRLARRDKNDRVNPLRLRLYRHSAQAGTKMAVLRDPARSVLDVHEHRTRVKATFPARHKLNVDTA